MPRQAIQQATCENCDDDEAEFEITDKSFPDNDPDDPRDAIRFEVMCDCRGEGVIVVDNQGTHSGEGINHENASWNTGVDDE